MYLTEIPKNVFYTTIIKIKYDCDGGFERCGKEWSLKYEDAKYNFEKNDGKHICRLCWLRSNNPFKRKEVQEKIKQTMLRKYGTTCILNTKENIEARVKKMFGTEEAAKEIAKKRRETNLEKYGVDHPMKNDEIKTKLKTVLTEKYGTHILLRNEEIKAKMQKTVQDRYGVSNVAKLPEIREKMAKTTMERYGVEHYNQLPEMKDYLRDNCTKWLAESYAAGGPSKGIKRPEEWNQKNREAALRLMDEGKWKGGPKHCIKGYYQSKKCKRLNPMFRSSYELKTHWHLDNDPEVEWYDYEPFKIAYYDTKGHKRYYVIDFVVKYNSGRMLAIEVKNDYSSKLELALLKKKSFKEECDKVLEYEMWTNNKIKSLNLDTDTLLESSLVKSLQDTVK